MPRRSWTWHVSALFGAWITLSPATAAIGLAVAATFGAARRRQATVGAPPRPEPGGGSELRRAIWVILAGGVTLSVPPALAHGSPAALAIGLQVGLMAIVLWVLRTWVVHGWVRPRAVATGMATGLATLAIVAVADAAGWLAASPLSGLGWGGYVGRAALWQAHPNVLATAAILPTVAVTSWGTLAASAVAAFAGTVLVVATGSRAALVVLLLALLVAFSTALWHDPRPAVRRGLVIGAILCPAIVLLLAATTTVLDRFDPRNLRPVAPVAGNLLYASEDLTAGSWSPVGVGLRRVAPPQPLRGERVWSVTKQAAAWWSRLQQGITVPAHSVVTLQVELQPRDHDAIPGLHAWSDAPGGPFELTVRRDDGSWRVVAVRGLELRGWSVEETDGWTRVSVTVANPSDVGAPIALGLTPDQRDQVVGAELWVRRPQAVLGGPTSYVATFPSQADGRRSLGTAGDRVNSVRLAWSGFLERPWFGYGVGAFRGFSAARAAAAVDPAGVTAPPGDHAHNLIAQTAFESGISGLAGLTLVFAGLALAGRRRVPPGWWPLLLVLLLNMPDVTFWTTPVSYGLAAVIGLAPTAAPGGRGRGDP